jgi:4-hydroxybenzoate polyprenyltransferase
MTTITAWLRLLRIPNVFTAFADIFAGFFLVSSAPFDWGVFALLLAASGSLYCAGMVLNDVFDMQRDLQERPGRPLPSGAISPRSAAMGGMALLLAGWGFAALVTPQAQHLATAIAVAVLLYDGVLKATPIAPLLMGVCRGLNLLLGMAAAGMAYETWNDPRIGLAVAMCLYITGVTWFARREATQSARGSLAGAWVLMNVGLVLLAGALMMLDASNFDYLALVLVVGILLGRRAWRAIRTLEPFRVQTTIRTAIQSLVILDAAMVLAVQGWVLALVTLALLIPATFLGRWIDPT